jgi:all-trans-retinol 13,14-reductase
VVDAAAFAPWRALPDARPQEYRSLKAQIGRRLLAQFPRHLPALRPMLRFHELSTPVTQQCYVRSPQGAMYGIEMSADRLTSPGIEGAFMGGMLAAAAVEPALWPMLR